MAASDYLVEQELNVQLGTNITARSHTYFALFTDIPNGTTADALAKEISPSGYARVSVACDSSHWSAPSQPGGTGTPWQVSNLLPIAFGTVGSGGWPTIKAVGEFDASSSGNFIRCVPLTPPVALLSGQNVDMPSGGYVIAKPVVQPALTTIGVPEAVLRYGSGAPGAGVGIDGDFYIDTTGEAGDLRAKGERRMAFWCLDCGQWRNGYKRHNHHVKR